MKFLADVNVPQSVIFNLREKGHDILDIKEKSLISKDSEIIKIAQREKRVIITKDKDFISFAQFPKYQVATIVVRLISQTPEAVTNRLTELLENQNKKILESSLTIVRETSAKSYPFK
jgi:predicted nuclease of predicted toxin-antitoxin system